MSSSLTDSRTLWGVLLLLVGGLSGCIEWLEVDDAPSEEAAPPLAALAPGSSTSILLPRLPARLNASGPILPRTPGLRVPEGYWSRIRIDQADMLLPFTWASLEPAGYSPKGEARGTLLRLQSHRVATPNKEDPSLRAVIRVATPPNTEISSLVGLSFGPEALKDSTVSLRLSKGTLWTVELERLVISAMDDEVISGTLEGQARAGKRAKRHRIFRTAFVALRP